MIDIGKYKNVLDQGLLLDHYSLLCCIRDGGELPKSKRIQGFINLLHKKGYLKEGVLTDIATALVDNDTVMCIKEVSNNPIDNIKTVGLLKTPVPTNDYMTWANALHKKLQDVLFDRTGRRQARGKINNTSYSFLPNDRDFAKVLLKVIVNYKLKDFDKIEKHLIAYVNRKINEKEWFPLVGYHIFKNGTSEMVTEMENMEEDEITNNDSTVNI